MKILLIHNYYQYSGGEEVYFENLKSLLINHGHQVWFYRQNSSRLSYSSLLNKSLAAIKFIFNQQNNTVFIKKIKRFDPDIVHVGNLYPLVGDRILSTIKHQFNKPIVQTIHSYRFLCQKHFFFRKNNPCLKCLSKNFKYPAIIHKCNQKSYLASIAYSCNLSTYFSEKRHNFIDHFIFPSEFAKKLYVAQIPKIKSKTTVIPNFTDFNKETLSKVYLPFNKFFLYVGRFSEEKGILQLLKLFISKTNYNLIAIGHGPLLPKLIKYQHFNNIRIINYLKPQFIKPIIKKAQALIVPSLGYEILPMVIIEAFMLKTPVITTTQPSLKRIIVNNDNGFVFDKNDFNKLIKVLNKVESDGEEVKQIVKKAYKQYQSYYSISNHYQRLMNLYDSLI